MRNPQGPGGASGIKVANLLNSTRDFTSPRPVKQVRKRQQPERQLQAALIERLAWQKPPGVWWAHYPAGGRRSRVTGAILKGMGAKAGVPDLLILSHGKLFGLELKAGRNGLSPAQVATHSEMRAAGAVIGTAGTLDDAIAILSEWGLLR
jgi:hypothetical protein